MKVILSNRPLYFSLLYLGLQEADDCHSKDHVRLKEVGEKRWHNPTGPR